MDSLADELYRYIASSDRSAELGETANAAQFRSYGRRRISRELDSLCEKGLLFRSAVRGKYFYSVKNNGSGERCNPMKARHLGISYDVSDGEYDDFFADNELDLPPIQPLNNSSQDNQFFSSQFEEDGEGEIVLPPIQSADNSYQENNFSNTQYDEEDELVLPPIQPADNSSQDNQFFSSQFEEDGEGEIALPPIQQVKDSYQDNQFFSSQFEEDGEGEIVLPPIQPLNISPQENNFSNTQYDEEDEEEIALPPIQQVNDSYQENSFSNTNFEEDGEGEKQEENSEHRGLPLHNQLYREYVQLPSQIARLRREISAQENRLAPLEEERERIAEEEKNAHGEYEERLDARNKEEKRTADMYGNVLRVRAMEQTRIENTLTALEDQKREAVKELESLNVFSVMRKKELNKQIEELDDRIRAAHKDMEAVVSSIDELKKQQRDDTSLQNSERELEFARNRYEQIRVSLERKDSEIRACRGDTERMKTELEGCMRRLERLRKEIADGRAKS